MGNLEDSQPPSSPRANSPPSNTFQKPFTAAPFSVIGQPASLDPAGSPAGGLSPFTSTVNISRFTKLLSLHPDQSLVSFVCSGLQCGFHIGYSGPRRNLVAPNLKSALDHADYVSEYLASCVQAGQTVGPFCQPPFNPMQCSGLGVVPKSNGRFRVIQHLSAPEGISINDQIDGNAFSLHYIKVDDAVRAIMQRGQGAYLSKLDIRNAFRLVPVHPDDQCLLGICWAGQFFYERVLPFGLRSSPFIFDKVATAIEWIVKHHFSVQQFFHYLDDFLVVSPSSYGLAQHEHDIVIQAFKYLAVPLAEEKLEGPVQSLTFLGIHLDTVQMTASLPETKLAELRILLTEFSQAAYTTQRKLDQFLGKLSFASTVIVPGRTFTRRLWDLNKRFSQARPYFRIKLNSECRKDLLWWKMLVERWNGKAFMLYNDPVSSDDLGIYTDASGSFGWGAFYCADKRWLQSSWSTENIDKDIAFKELYALLATCSTWGHLWSRQRIVVHCDNMTVVECIRSGTSRAPQLMCLLRSLFLVCSQHSFTVCARHVAGHYNAIADALSRARMQVFRQLAPQARQEPDPIIPPPLLDC